MVLLIFQNIQKLYKTLEDKPDEYLIQERTRFINKGSYLELFNITSKTIPAELITLLISKYNIADEEINLIEDVYNYALNKAQETQWVSVQEKKEKEESLIQKIKNFLKNIL